MLKGLLATLHSNLYNYFTTEINMGNADEISYFGYVDLIFRIMELSCYNPDDDQEWNKDHAT